MIHEVISFNEVWAFKRMDYVNLIRNFPLTWVWDLQIVDPPPCEGQCMQLLHTMPPCNYVVKIRLRVIR